MAGRRWTRLFDPSRQRRAPTTHRASGYSLFEIGLALAVAGLAANQFWPMLRQAQEPQRDAVIATQMWQFTDAAQRYTTANAAAIETAITANGPVAITSAMLINTGQLPSTWSSTNTYGQGFVAVVRRITGVDPNGNGINCESDSTEECPLQVLAITEGGSAMPTLTAAGAATMIASGGQGVIGGVVASSSQVTGVLSSWTADPAQFNASGVTYASGHVAAMSFVPSYYLASAFLSRYTVPGVPEDTTLHTNVTLGDLGSTTLDSGVYNVNIVAGDGSATFQKPTCPAGLSPHPFVAPFIEYDPNGQFFNGFAGHATDNGNGTYTPLMQVHTSSGWVTEPAVDNQVLVLTKCQ